MLNKPKSPLPLQDWSSWDLERFAKVGPQAIYGDFTELGALAYRIQRDWRYGTVRKAIRAGILEAIPVVISSKPTPLFHRWLSLWKTTGAFFQAVELIPLCGRVVFQAYLAENGLPTLETHSVVALRLKAMGDNNNEWELDIADGSATRPAWGQKKTFTPRKRGWFFGEEYSTAYITAGWTALGPLVISKAQAWVAWSRVVLHASLNPLLITGLMDSIEGSDEFKSNLQQLTQIVVLEVPDGTEVRREPNPNNDATAARQQVEEADRAIGEFELGQASTTRLLGGSYNAVNVLEEKSSNIIAVYLAMLSAALRYFFEVWEDYTGEKVERLEWLVLSSADRTEMVNNAKTLLEAGANIDLHTVAKRVNLPEGGNVK